MKGWMIGRLRFAIVTAVAAAASDPSSLTSTTAFTHTAQQGIRKRKVLTQNLIRGPYYSPANAFLALHYFTFQKN